MEFCSPFFFTPDNVNSFVFVWQNRIDRYHITDDQLVRMNNTGTIRLPHFDGDNFHKITLKNIEFSIYIIDYMRLTVTKINDDINRIAVDHNKASSNQRYERIFSSWSRFTQSTLFFMLCQTFFRRILSKRKKKKIRKKERKKNKKHKQEKEVPRKR